MLEAPISLTPRSKTNWRDKIKRRSFQSPKPSELKAFQTPESRVPSLSSSRGSTPGFRRSRESTPRQNLPDEDVFLTALDVIDAQSLNEFDLLKDSHVLKRGNLTIPPPPPKNKAIPRFPDQHQTGPKIKPFATNPLVMEPRHSECFICHELLETKLETEKLVPLSCGDCVHSECLHISAIFALEQAIDAARLSPASSEASVKRTMLPICQGKRCKLQSNAGMVDPLEESFVEELISEAMLTLKLTNIPVVARRNDTPDTPTPHNFENSKNFESFKNDKQNLLPSTPEMGSNFAAGHTSLMYANRVSQFFTTENFELRVRPDISAKPTGSSSILTSPQISPLSRLPVQKQSFLRKSFPPNAFQSTVSLDEMRNIVIKHMLHAYEIDLGLLTSLGSLKLVDKLSVSFDDQDFSPQTAYLFTNYLVVGRGPSPCLFPLRPKFSLTTPKTTVLRLESSAESVPLLHLHCEVSSVVEKWGIAVSDTSLSIPADLVTSTLSMDELMTSSEEESEKTRESLVHSRRISKRSAHASLNSEFYKAFSRDSVAKASSRDVDDFEQELISYGLVPSVITEFHEPQISPLHIVRRTSNDIPVLLSYSDSEPDLNADSDASSDSKSDSDSGSDSDSDSELIAEIKNKYF